MLSEGLSYISSEESGEEEDGRPVYIRRPLTLLKPKYHKSLRRLDTLYYESLAPKSKQMYRKRCDGEPSNRAHPMNAPRYLLVEAADPDDLDSSITSSETSLD